MKHRTLRGVAALTLGASLLLAGCASGDGGSDAETSSTPSETTTDAATTSPEDLAALEGVTVSGDEGDVTLEFETPFEVSTMASLSLEDGDGEPLEDGQQLTMHSVVYSGADGTVLGSTWENEMPDSIGMGDETLIPQLTEVLEGKNVGTRFLFANPTTDPQTQEPITYLTVAEITAAREIPSRAEGEAVTPEDGLPVVTLDDDGKPSVEIPEGYEAPDDLVVQTLIKGDGPEVTEDQTVTAHYTGWKLDGEQFDSSWDRGSPSSFSLQQVVAGWTQGLAGQTVGSQVLLVIPPSLGYGASEGHELQNETLVFVVDILDAQ
ncbi:FKBP-type peptidyl-prolyl cis-trans isomerase [Cellulosimicrobium marinum]|uniref:FKBP-type peptidyl-prolyl cis-trans isomerase n=1 Tax=Cellulosimicrobium marinum TaxID=1638992 RepID=UPI001E3A861B|nr:FKBP-type peptidyl-prolyl cis-trans isomerase [Cellulosimicrobium marinum]MCB7138040.1 FKBP-type peptidyl-prolyl cis-trans isomerase [Cellulosimicrobium marinum]